MKILYFVPAVLGFKLPGQNEKICAPGPCNSSISDLFADVPPLIINATNRDYCVNEVLEDRIYTCERYGASYDDCAEYLVKESEMYCHGDYNCIVGEDTNVASWGRYHAYGSRFL